MKTIEEYLRHAEECDALAKSAISPAHRQQIEEMAAIWRTLAEQRRKKLAAA